MLKKTLRPILKIRSYWRNISFDEVAVLYLSKNMRLFAIKLTSTFNLIYLYNLGYSIRAVLAYLLVYFTAKFVGSMVSFLYISKNGPKHGMLLGNILYIPVLILMASIGGFNKEFGLTIALIGAVFRGLSGAISGVSYHVNFSKVKNAKKVGGQLGIANILEQLVSGITPAAGAFFAIFFGLDKLFIVSSVILVLTIIPLLVTKEQVKINQKVSFRGFPWRNYKHLSIICLSTGMAALSTTTWSFLASVFILKGVNNYGSAGILASIASISAFVAAFTYGKIIDRNKEGGLLKISSLFMGMVHSLRVFIGSNPTFIGFSEILGGISSSGFDMANSKGLYGEADESGMRTQYLCIYGAGVDLSSVLGVLLLFWIFANTSSVDPTGETALRIIVFISGILVLPMIFVNYRVYRNKKRQFKE